MGRARAILLESTRVDTSGAEVYGDVVELFDREHRRPTAWLPDEIGLALENRLAEIGYNPNCDMIIVSGSTALLTVAVAWLGCRFGRFDALIFDTRDLIYRRLTLGGQHARV